MNTILNLSTSTKYKPVATDYFHGNLIYRRARSHNWYYADTNELVNFRVYDKPCPNCGNTPSKDGHDGCIANLPDVNYACCGHGIKGMGYLYLSNGTLIYERSTPELFFEILKKLKEKRDKLQQI